MCHSLNFFFSQIILILQPDEYMVPPPNADNSKEKDDLEDLYNSLNPDDDDFDF